MNKNNRYNKENKSISPHHISFDPSDKEKELKGYLLKQYDKLGLTQYFDWEYVIDLREEFFTLLKDKDVWSIVDIFPPISSFHLYDDTLDYTNQHDEVFFLWINFGNRYGDILSLDVYSMSYDYNTDKYSIKLWDIEIMQFFSNTDLNKFFIEIRLVSNKVIDWFSQKIGQKDKYINTADEIRKTIMTPEIKKKLSQFENKLYTYGLEKWQRIYFIDDKIKPKGLHKNINWNKLDKTSLYIEKIYPEKWKLIVSNGVQKFTLRIDDLYNIGIKWYDDMSHDNWSDERHNDFDDEH